MRLKNIPHHVLSKYYAMIFIIFLILESFIAVFVHNFFYEQTQNWLVAKTNEIEVLFNSSPVTSEEVFKNKIFNYIENFKDKEFLDVSAFDANGNVLTSFTNTYSDVSRINYIEDDIKTLYLQNENLNIKTHVIILTKVIKDDFDNAVGGVQYIFPLAKTDSMLLMAVLASLLLMVLLFCLLGLLNKIFINSMLTPIREVSKTSRKIALGDFKARLTTRYDGDIGELCDTVNFMAQKLDESEKLKNDFISSVSHELRTPLTAIKGWAETIQLSGERDVEMNKKGLNIIVHESERLCGIVEELLDFSKMQSGRMILNLEKMDILAELSEAVYMFKERALEEKKMLLYSEPELLSPVLGDKNRLRQVFINVIDNALKYTQENGVVNVDAKEKDSNVIITITDNGYGISSEHLPKVKEKFYKANMTQKGSGIGLAIANEIMLLHSGTLSLQSEENIGTVVTITIPVV